MFYCPKCNEFKLEYELEERIERRSLYSMWRFNATGEYEEQDELEDSFVDESIRTAWDIDGRFCLECNTVLEWLIQSQEHAHG